MAQSQVPLKLRKQMLLMRAAVERVELAQHVLDVREAATLSAVFRNALPGDRSRSFASRGIDMLKRYPFMTSAVSIVASRFKLPIIAFAAKWGGTATVGYKLWELWKKSRGDSRRRSLPRLRDSRFKS